MALTLVLLAILGAIFLKGFKEAIGVAVVLVAVYLASNIVVTAVGMREVLRNPQLLANWKAALFAQHGNPFTMLGIALVLFPKLALGLSGFETGVGGHAPHPSGRRRRTRPQHTQAAGYCRIYYERIPDGHQRYHDTSGPTRPIQRRWRGEWARSGLSWPQASRRRLRIVLRL